MRGANGYKHCPRIAKRVLRLGKIRLPASFDVEAVVVDVRYHAHNRSPLSLQRFRVAREVHANPLLQWILPGPYARREFRIHNNDADRTRSIRIGKPAP